jgi:hypothetical protein
VVVAQRVPSPLGTESPAAKVMKALEEAMQGP